MLTAEYLTLKKYESLTKNTKVYFGNSIPDIFSDGVSVSAESLRQNNKNN